jgi:transcriptional regulator with XRE-family HTH domain
LHFCGTFFKGAAFMQLADKVNELCKNAGTSMNALEKAIGLGKGTICRWNDVMPSVDKVEKVADYFGVSIDYLLERSPVDEVGEMLEFLHKNPEMKVLLSSSSKLRKSDLDAVVTIVRRMNREDDYE